MLITLDSHIDHHGAVTWYDDTYHAIASWGWTDEGAPITRIQITDSSGDGQGLIWEGTRPGHLTPAQTLAAIRLHLPPAPEWADFGRRETVIVEPTPGPLMQMQRDRLEGRYELAGVMSTEDLVFEGWVSARAERTVMDVFRGGGISAVDALVADVDIRALAALHALRESRLPGGIDLMCRHIAAAAERLAQVYDAA